MEAREAATQLLAAVVSQNPSFFELTRDRLGRWQQATEDAASNGGTQPTGYTERPGWSVVRDLWEGAGSAAADLYMEWPDRNQVLKKIKKKKKY